MAHMIVRVATVALALLVANEIIDGISIDSLTTALLAAIVLGLLNSIAKPILVLLTLPITIITLGLFIIVINVTLFAVAAWLLPGFAITGVLPAIFGTLLVSIASVLIQKVQKADS